MAELENTMNVTAEFNSVETTAQSTVIVQLGNMTLIKSANQNPWLDGELIYTVTLENIESTGDITEIVFTDNIDITKSRLDTTTITVNGDIITAPAFTYDPATGDLEIPYAPALAPGGRVTITFRVTKV